MKNLQIFRTNTVRSSKSFILNLILLLFLSKVLLNILPLEKFSEKISFVSIQKLGKLKTIAPHSVGNFYIPKYYMSKNIKAKH